MRRQIGQILVASCGLVIGCNQPVAQSGTSTGAGLNGGSAGGASTGAATTGAGTAGSAGTSGGNNAGGSSGGNAGGTSGGSGQSPTEAQLCTYVWQGFARADLLTAATIAQGSLHPPSGTYCPTPTPSQANAIANINAAITNDMLNLPPPDGGWPDGSGPTVCDNLNDTSSSVVQLAGSLEASLAAGRVVWNAGAAAACAQGMVATDYLLIDGGTTNVPVTSDGGPCIGILTGEVGAGSACTFSFDCQPGLFCRPTGGNSCSGSCAALVADGLSCGPFDKCVSSDSCSNGLCTSSGSSSPGSGEGLPDAPCTQTSDCQNCLSCQFVSDGGMVCVAPGLLGATCQSDSDCATPLLYCKQGTCATTGSPGDTGCLSTSDNSCLFSWCQPAGGGASGTCVGSSNLGGPCVDNHSCSAGYCADAGGNGTCTAEPGQGQPCASGACDSNLYCDQTTLLCEATLGGGAACTDGSQCQSMSCLSGQCASPCVTGCGSNCLDGPGASLLLGLGGAMALQRRRRRPKLR